MIGEQEDLPAGWAWATLGDLVDRLQYGHTASADSEAEGPRFLRITDLREDGITWGEVPGCVATSDDIEKYALRDGDVVFARTGSIEKAAVVRNPPEAVFASYLIRGRPLVPILSEWIGHFVRTGSYLEQIGAAGAGIGRENVNATKLSAVRIPVAPEPEQRRIVAKLDELLASSRAARTALDAAPVLLEQYRRAVLAAAFRGDLTSGSRPADAVWQQLAVTDVASEIVDCPHSTPKYGAGECLAIDTTCIDSKGIRHERLRRVDSATYAERTKRLRPRAGDVVFAREGTVGTAVVIPEGLDVCLGQRVMLIRPASSMNSDFLRLALMSPQVRAQYQGQLAGSTVAHLNVRDVKRLQVPVPDEQEQAAVVRAIRDRLRALESVGERARETLASLRQLEAATLSKAFRGEVVAQDPTEESASVLLQRLRSARADAQGSRRPRRVTARA